MAVKLIPSACVSKGKAKAQFDGFLMMRQVTFDEKYQYLEDFTTEGEEGEEPSRKDQIKRLRSMVSSSKAHYEEVKLTRLKDEKRFASFEDLSLDPGCHEILIEVATQMLGGFEVGEN